MIATEQITAIDGVSLTAWLERALAPLLPAGTHISVIPRPGEAQGESRFFSAIDVEAPLTLEGLRDRGVKGHRRGPYVHYYADDVVAAAVAAGELTGSCFWLYVTC